MRRLIRLKAVIFLLRERGRLRPSPPPRLTVIDLLLLRESVVFLLFPY